MLFSPRQQRQQRLTVPQGLEAGRGLPGGAPDVRGDPAAFLRERRVAWIVARVQARWRGRAARRKYPRVTEV